MNDFYCRPRLASQEKRNIQYLSLSEKLLAPCVCAYMKERKRESEREGEEMEGAKRFRTINFLMVTWLENITPIIVLCVLFPNVYY